MVATVRRIARRPWSITAQNGDHFELKIGKDYETTLEPYDDGCIIVFSRYWLRVPLDRFELDEPPQVIPRWWQRLRECLP
jgi:hypothetical protein